MLSDPRHTSFEPLAPDPAQRASSRQVRNASLREEFRGKARHEGMETLNPSH